MADPVTGGGRRGLEPEFAVVVLSASEVRVLIRAHVANADATRDEAASLEREAGYGDSVIRLRSHAEWCDDRVAELQSVLDSIPEG